MRYFKEILKSVFENALDAIVFNAQAYTITKYR